MNEKDCKMMSKGEALAYTLSTHKPIFHAFFGEGEYVYYDGKDLRDESGGYLDYNEFWNIRTGGGWENGWFKYEG